MVWKQAQRRFVVSQRRRKIASRFRLFSLVDEAIKLLFRLLIGSIYSKRAISGQSTATEGRWRGIDSLNVGIAEKGRLCVTGSAEHGKTSENGQEMQKHEPEDEATSDMERRTGASDVTNEARLRSSTPGLHSAWPKTQAYKEAEKSAVLVDLR